MIKKRENTKRELGEKRIRKLLLYTFEQRYITAQNAKALLQVKHDDIYVILRKLVNKNLLTKVLTRYFNYYKITREGIRFLYQNLPFPFSEDIVFSVKDFPVAASTIDHYIDLTNIRLYIEKNFKSCVWLSERILRMFWDGLDLDFRPDAVLMKSFDSETWNHFMPIAIEFENTIKESARIQKTIDRYISTTAGASNCHFSSVFIFTAEPQIKKRWDRVVKSTLDEENMKTIFYVFSLNETPTEDFPHEYIEDIDKAGRIYRLFDDYILFRYIKILGRI